MSPAKTGKNQTGSRDVHLLAGLSHLSILTVIILGPFSMVIPLMIWLLERNKTERSTYIEFQAKQAFFYQVALYLMAATLFVVIILLSIIVIGLFFIPLLILFGIAALVYGFYAGIKVMQGEDFRYIYIADFIEAGGTKNK